ncbi:MAG: hypothetical protein F6K30_04150 [Cyanothece sp. SIO2G6]|nr:hypothetical protein [Cyanothece sp. SIO2G6]
MDKKERKRLIRQIKEASGIALYALEEKMTDEQVLEASQNLTVLSLVKSSNTYNRYCQGKKTEEANNRLKEFLKPENSEIVKTGRWLLKALAKKGDDRKQALLEQDLVHKEDYNNTVVGMRDTIEAIHDADAQLKDEAQQNIRRLERKIDQLRKQQEQVKQYIRNNYGSSTWKAIAQTFEIELEDHRESS